MGFINTSYFFEAGEDGSEQRFRLFALEQPDGGALGEEDDPDALFDGVAIAASDGAQLCESLEIGGSVDMPEHRLVSRRHTYEKNGVLVTIKSPVPQRRVYSKTLFATYCVGPDTDESVRAQIRRTLQQVLKGSVLVAAIGAPGQALPAFMELVTKSLTEQGMMVSGGLKLGLYTEKTCDAWQDLPQPKVKKEETAPPEPVVEIRGGV